MVIGVDVDEVVADLLGTWISKYNTAWNDQLLVEQITDWDTTLFVKPECGSKIYDILCEPDLYEDVKPIAGALVEIEALRSKGHKVVYATSCVRCMIDQKMDWLVRHGFISTI